MRPVLWQGVVFGWPVTLRAYGTSLVLAALVVVALGTVLAARKGLPWRKILPCLVLIALVVPVGARLYYCWLYPEFGRNQRSFAAILQFNGFAFDGGFVAGAVVGAAFCRRFGLCPWRLADAIAPAAALGLCLLRGGCFLKGCCHGVESDLPWTVRFPVGSPAFFNQLPRQLDVFFNGPRPVHPTQIYEGLAALAAGGLAVLLARRRLAPGTAALAGAAVFLVFRWIDGPFRFFDGVDHEMPRWLPTVACLMLLGWRSRDLLKRKAIDPDPGPAA